MLTEVSLKRSVSSYLIPPRLLYFSHFPLNLYNELTHSIKQYVTDIEHPTAIDKKSKMAFLEESLGGNNQCLFSCLGCLRDNSQFYARG